MKVRKPSEMTIEELLKNEKLITILLYTLITFTVIFIFLVAFLILKKGFTPLIVMPLSMVTFIIISSSSLKKIRKEIALRSNK